MNGTLVIARRELAEKRFVFIAAIALSIMVFFMPLVPGVPAGRGREVLVVAAAILAVAFSLGLANILGSTMVGRELTEKRLSFYFAKPITAPAIWFGKLIAAAILVSATCLIVLVPAMVAGADAVRRVWTGEGYQFLTFFAIITTVFFFMAHVISTIARSRSPWAFLDLLALAGLSFAGWLVARPLVDAQAILMALLILKIFGWLLLAAAIAAGAWQLTVGRTDRQQSHYALSRFLWPAIAVVIAICGGIVLWVVTPSVKDLTGQFGVVGAPRSEYAIVGGQVRHRLDYPAAFVINVRTGEATRFRAADAHFTDDGSKLVVLRPIDRRTNTVEVFLRNVLGDTTEKPTGLTVNRYTWFSSNADASRIASISEGVLSVYDVARKQSLGSVKVPTDGYIPGFWFAGPDTIRMYSLIGERKQNVARTLRVFEYDLKSRTFAKTGEYLSPIPGYIGITANADGSRLLVRAGREVTAVLDGRTAAPLTSLPAPNASYLSDGRYIGLPKNALAVFRADGSLERSIALPGPSWYAQEIAPGKVLVTLNQNRNYTSGRGWSNLLIDVNSGQILRRENGLQPHYLESRTARWAPLNPDQLFTAVDGSLVRWNPLTNEKTVLLKKS